LHRCFEDKLTAIPDDIGVSIGRVDRAREAAENTREEPRMMSEEVSIMWRQIKRLEEQMRDLTGEP
jgi:hypothetical protein